MLVDLFSTATTRRRPVVGFAVIDTVEADIEGSVSDFTGNFELEAERMKNEGNEEVRAKWNLIVEIGDELILKLERGILPKPTRSFVWALRCLNLSF